MFIRIAALCLFISTQNSFAQYSGTNSQKTGWSLSAQAWTFNRFTLSESLDMMKAAGIDAVEMYPDQQIGGGIVGISHFTMDSITREKVLDLISSKGMKVVSYGVASAKDQAEWVKLFDFAKALGIKTIVAEPDSVQLNYIEPLCVKYQINVALHNHPDPAVYGHPSIYWNPDKTIKQLVNRNKYIGVCADLGHWIRSGMSSMEALKICQGRILAVHAKDIVPGSDGFCGYHDVPWGTGISDFSGLMHELKRQGYEGTITLEYEYHWENSFDEVKESAAYFNRLMHWMSLE